MNLRFVYHVLFLKFTIYVYALLLLYRISTKSFTRETTATHVNSLQVMNIKIKTLGQKTYRLTELVAIIRGCFEKEC